MVSTAAGFSVRNLPSMAVEGWSLIFWYVLGTVLFLLPLALTAAELASTWPKCFLRVSSDITTLMSSDL